MGRMIGMVLMAVGALAVFFGTVFVLQSVDVLGPDSSSMVENSDWTVYGLLVMVAGVIAVVSGRILRRQPQP
jgi:hypothetical protein